jgi:hypothetical protein
MLVNDRGETLGRSAAFDQFKNFWFAGECRMQSNAVKCQNMNPGFVKYKKSLTNKAMHRSPPHDRLKIVNHRGRTSVILVDYEVQGLQVTVVTVFGFSSLRYMV